MFEDTPPIGIVVAVRPWTTLESVRYLVQRIREQRAKNGPFEDLFTEDLRATLRERHNR
jgi:hypothetical protein